MRRYETVIAEAELMASSPEVVAEFLKQRAAGAEQTYDSWDRFGQEFEAALRSKADPLIDLALARYAKYIATVLPMFQSGQIGGATRLAILSNALLANKTLPSVNGIPVALFDNSRQIADWLANAPRDELDALFQNPMVDGLFLAAVLKRADPWSDIKDAQFLQIVAALIGNEGLRIDRYDGVHNAAWKLSESVDPSNDWATVLSRLFHDMKTNAASLEKPLEISARWFPPSPNVDSTQRETKQNSDGELSYYQGVRKGLARLALSKNSQLLPVLLASKDVAFRAAAYADGQMTPEQLSVAYENDGELIFKQGMNNPLLWRHASTRAILKQILGLNQHPWRQTHYDDINKKMFAKHPDWFKDDEDYPPEIDYNDEPATKADVRSLSDRLTRSNATILHSIGNEFVKFVNARYKLVWLVGGAMLVILIKQL